VSDFVKTESGLLVPSSLRHNVQMAKPVVFWINRKRDFIMNPPGPDCIPPTGYERIECRHAHEADAWSARLRAQEKRIHEMTVEERYVFEDAIRFDMLEELKKQLAESQTPQQKMFLTAAIEHFTQRRDAARPTHQSIESHMGFEAEEGVAS
jgi:hypothetical protein